MKANSPAPFLHSGIKAVDYPLSQLWCLLPAGAWGVIRYGWYAAIVLGVAVLAAYLTDLVMSRLRRRRAATAQAMLVGLLIGMCLPPEIPLFVPVVAAGAGIFLGYALLGSASTAWIHPAGLGLVVATLSWPAAMATTSVHLTSGAVASSPMSGWYALLAGSAIPGQTPSDAASFFSPSARPDLLEPVQNWLHAVVHLPVPEHISSTFLGFGYGAIGLTSPVLLLIGSIVLFGRGAADWRPAAAAFLTFAALTWAFAGLAWGIGLGHGDVLFFLLNGSFLLVLCFMMHHHAALPLTRAGRLLYGLFLGLTTWVVLVFGRLELGAVIALVFSNVWVPMIDARTRLGRPSRQP